MGALGATLAGGCSAGIYPTDTAQQVEFKAKHSGAVVVFLESPKKVEIFLKAQPNLPKLKAIVCWTPDDTLPKDSAVRIIISIIISEERASNRVYGKAL